MALSTTFTQCALKTTKFTQNKTISPFKVTDFGTNQKLIYDLPAILHHLRDMAFEMSIKNVKDCGYNTQFLLYPRPLTCQKEFLLFYMCQLWALHVVIKRQFFYIYTCSFSTKFISQMHIIAQAYLRCCGIAKTNGRHTGIILAVSIW